MSCVIVSELLVIIIIEKRAKRNTFWDFSHLITECPNHIFYVIVNKARKFKSIKLLLLSFEKIYSAVCMGWKTSHFFPKPKPEFGFSRIGFQLYIVSFGEFFFFLSFWNLINRFTSGSDHPHVKEGFHPSTNSDACSTFGKCARLRTF